MLRLTVRKLRSSPLRFGEVKTRWGDFFQNDKNPSENIGSETNSPGKPRSRASEVALRAPVAADSGGVAFEQAHASIEWPGCSCAGSRARKIKLYFFILACFFCCCHLRSAAGWSIVLPFAVAGRPLDLPHLCGGRKTCQSSPPGLVSLSPLCARWRLGRAVHASQARGSMFISS